MLCLFEINLHTSEIADDTYFTYEKAICQTMAERQANQIAQEKAKKTKKAKHTGTEITDLLYIWMIYPSRILRRIISI